MGPFAGFGGAQPPDGFRHAALQAVDHRPIGADTCDARAARQRRKWQRMGCNGRERSRPNQRVEIASQPMCHLIRNPAHPNLKKVLALFAAPPPLPPNRLPNPPAMVANCWSGDIVCVPVWFDVLVPNAWAIGEIAPSNVV